MVRTVAIIPARGGSKGVPRKNIRFVNDFPLISYSIKAALNSKQIQDVFVSTEDKEIAEVSEKFKAKIIPRPMELAQDKSSTIDVIIHAVKYLTQKGMKPDNVILLQPTSPLRTSEDIDKAMEIFLNNECDSVISVVEMEHPPYWCYKLTNKFMEPLFGEEYLSKRRQDLPKTFSPNGAIYIAKPSIIEKYKGFDTPRSIPYLMSNERSMDIDSEFDLQLVDFIMKQHKIS
jgi:CMP-N,N'-diacetyllegionaminic acid synthase